MPFNFSDGINKIYRISDSAGKTKISIKTKYNNRIGQIY
jgi:hypothetical protein